MSNGASNFGEFFYVYQPVANGTGYSGGTPDNWYRTIRSTFIHESKHVASQAARVANDAPAYEAAWLEEGTARHAEELWVRNAVYNVAWKGNTGYGSAATPSTSTATCGRRSRSATPTRGARRRSCSGTSPRCTRNMFGTNARLLSPFGPHAIGQRVVLLRDLLVARPLRDRPLRRVGRRVPDGADPIDQYGRRPT